jgi:tetratricopeptide (TPR) repeat protein
LVLVLWALLSIGCAGTPDLAEFRGRIADRGPEQRGDLTTELQRIEDQRLRGELLAARQLALQLASEQPTNAAVLHAASRSESDAIVVWGGDPEREQDRELAAWSALDYARSAVADSSRAAHWGQYSWAMGTSTHLQPMFERGEHAARTLDAIERALQLDAQQPRALATRALLELRLATLPWIAKVMATDAPRATLEQARSSAGQLVELQPSREHRWILAQALLASDRLAQAIEVLEVALNRAPSFPRDQALNARLQQALQGWRSQS